VKVTPSNVCEILAVGTSLTVDRVDYYYNNLGYKQWRFKEKNI